jgi:hypothetical protein
MPSFPFGELAPDRADLEPGMIDVRNVLPGPSGYLPFHSFVAATNALGARPRGAIQARDKNGDVYQYAGDATKLYQNVDAVWTDKSGAAYATGSGEVWEFVAWKNKILATNFTNNPQSITFGGAAFADLTAALRARHIAVVRDFVVLGNTFDGVDGDVPARVRWCAFGNETDWTVSPSTLADYQDLKTSKVERIFGGEYAVILQPDNVWRMTFSGAPTVFQFDQVLPGIGVIAPGAAAQDGEIIYFLSSKGFFALDRGTQATPIGIGRVDEFIRADLDLTQVHRMSTVADPNSKRVYWAYPGAGNVNGRPNRIIIYDRAQDRWALVEAEVELIWGGGGTGRSLDAAATTGDPDNLDDMATDVSFDDPRWVGGAPFVAAFDEDFASGSFSGTNLTALLTTKEYALSDGARTQLNGFRALIQGGTSTTITARVGTRNSLIDTVSYGVTLSARPEQRFTTRANARYHRFQLTVTGDWQHAIGLEIGRNDLRSGGVRG